MKTNPLRIGKLTIDPPVILAPMAAITTPAVRKIAEDFGAGMTFTEMVSSAALFRGVEAARNLVRRSNPDRLFAVQIFGVDPHEMAYSAWYLVNCGVDYIDINMGCPMKDIVSNGSGSALMKTPELAGRIVREVIESVENRVPVTVKIRAGWDFSSINAVEFAMEMEKAGAKAITVHGRTRSQLYNGKSNPDIIKDVKTAVSIPVIANGDIKSSEDAFNLMNYTGADGVMIARGSFGNPWIFKDTARCFKTGDCKSSEITSEDRLKIILRHLDLIEEDAEADSLQHSRKQIAWYSKNMHDSSSFRQTVFSTADINSLRKMAVEIFSGQKP